VFVSDFRAKNNMEIRIRRFVAAQSGLELRPVIHAGRKCAFAVRNFETKAVRDQQVDA
jgi:hypothetical protein